LGVSGRRGSKWEKREEEREGERNETQGKMLGA